MITSLAERRELRERVAWLIGASALTPDGAMICPSCNSDGFGATSSLEELSVYQLGWLPGYPLLAGICMTCTLITHPRPGYDACRTTFAALDGHLLAICLPEPGYCSTNRPVTVV